ncbi:hypothetical protein PGT21_007605 [Puccinia graminis f. sp. tritici]|uniref:Uncharacterized protein n=2 Tax=Puccinia graminis f. sp. tritici TaxID=56615 RepID=A0A5B0RGC5_PUCGR|nr:hypothetical protein PGT21_007605 [Puccinia graminis f. sp. tritici]KAA1124941.1 hypothetical protein PGTUg99_037016 [Puccinia graminis f. sp. tritici]
MDRISASERLHPTSEKRHSGYSILVVPPCFHPVGNITSSSSEKHSTLFPIHPGGIIIPLQSTLKNQISEVARYFTLPSTLGLSLHANVSIHGSLQSTRPAGSGSDCPLPLISAASWNSLFFGYLGHDDTPKPQTTWMGPSRPSGIGVLVRLEFRIDYHTASWYEAWLMATLCRKVQAPGDLDESVEEIRRQSSMAASSSSSESSQSTAPTSLNPSPVQFGLMKITGTLDAITPSPTPRDGSTRAIRSRSIHLLSQARQYRRNHPNEPQWVSKTILQPVRKNRNSSQDFDLFMTPPSSASNSVSENSVPKIEYQEAHVASREERALSSVMSTNETNSEDSDSTHRAIDKKFKISCESSSTDQVYNHPNTSDDYFQSRISEPGKSVMMETGASEGSSIDREGTQASAAELAANQTAPVTPDDKHDIDKRSSGVNIISDWKNFLSNMSPASASTSKVVESDESGSENRSRRVPQRLNLEPAVEISNAVPVISPSSNTPSPVGSTFAMNKTPENLHVEQKQTQNRDRNSDVSSEGTSASGSRSPRPFLNSSPSSSIWKLSERGRKPWSLSKIVENIRSDSVNKKASHRGHPLRTGSYSSNDLLAISNSSDSLIKAGKHSSSSLDGMRKYHESPGSSIAQGSSHSSNSKEKLSVTASDSSLDQTAARRAVPMRVANQSNPGPGSESNRTSKVMESETEKAHPGTRGSSHWSQSTANCFPTFLPLSLNRMSSVSSLSSVQPVIHKARKVEIVNNSTSRLTTLKPPA